jgi:hypothetical protein
MTNLLSKKIVLILLVILPSYGFCVSDTISITDSDVPFFNRKPKNKKIKKKKVPKKNTPSKASLLRLKSQSYQAKSTINRTGRKNSYHKKKTLKTQRFQKKFSVKKNRNYILKDRSVKRKKPKHIRKVKGLDTERGKH